jgi:endonuclease YncB( thermonuclease family)
LTSAKQQIKVRIAFIDAPEKGQAFGQRAKAAMSALVFGKDVELLPHTRDRYGHVAARMKASKDPLGILSLRGSVLAQ